MLGHPQIAVDILDGEGETALHRATSYGHGRIIAALLSQGADINRANNAQETPLVLAIYNGYTNIVLGLLEYPTIWIDPIRYDYALLAVAAHQADIQILEALLRHPGINPNVKDPATGNTLLHWAAGLGDFIIVEMLLSHSRTDRHVQNNNGQIPFEIVHPQSFTRIARLLNPKDIQGF